MSPTITYTKLIDCPSHPGQHKAILYCIGHNYEGTWECPKTGYSDAHDHLEAVNQGDAELVVETGEVDTMRNGEHDTYQFSYYICGGQEGCGMAIDPEIADPQQDAADALFNDGDDQ